MKSKIFDVVLQGLTGEKGEKGEKGDKASITYSHVSSLSVSLSILLLCTLISIISLSLIVLTFVTIIIGFRWRIFTCAQKLANSQLNLPLGTKQKRLMKKLKIKTEMLRRNGPVIKPWSQS